MPLPDAYLDDGDVVLHLGDCVEVMATLEAESVDAVVTDPPYGLEFMGKEWDDIGTGRKGNPFDPSKPKMTTAPEPVRGDPWASERPSYGAPKKNARCRRCGGRRFQIDTRPSKCRCEFPDWDTRTAEHARTMQHWHQTWATQALRVLRPGGHLLAFGGSRTFHRLTCAIEDAGFEVRDCLSWLYGSGFPKSLDVSKAIDRAAGREAAPPSEDVAAAGRVALWLRKQCEQRGIGSRAINEHFGTANIAMRWLMVGPSWTKRPQVPRWDHWEELRSWLDLPDDMDVEVWRLNGNKGRPAPLAFTRDPKVYDESHGYARLGLAHGAQKSHTATAQVEELGYATGPGDAPITPEAAAWQGWGTALKPAWEPIVVARKPLAGTVAANVLAHGTGAINVDGCRVGADGEVISQSGRVESMARATIHPGYDRPGRTMYRTDKPLERSGPADPAGRWPANVILSHTPDCREVGVRKVKAKPYREVRKVQTNEWDGGGAWKSSGFGRKKAEGACDDFAPDTLNPDPADRDICTSCFYREVDHGDGTETVAAWECSPDCPVRRLDEEVGESTSARGRQQYRRAETSGWRERGGSFTPGREWEAEGYGDTGGPSRFFYTAKASSAERDGASHPTVKPLALMRWLVRLVTPPGGTVLDPFAGSGTTGLAAREEQMRAILIEREPEYCEMAAHRLRQLSLFGELG